ncbi:SH3 domain-containing protein [Actinomadura atramentaria]|uniref:SH3 domain-containing protein n=1 Tax=Actinomadura atramentaria TaxID=1990 RepID=UPI00035E6CD3|nr:SH3 domain-containing protein [Actinomadura atramentaria]
MKRSIAVAAVAAAVLGGGLVSASAATASPASGTPGVLSASAPRPRHYAYGKVTSSTLDIRSRPTTHSRKLGYYKRGQKLELECWVPGEKIHRDATWYKLGPHNENFSGVGYVAGHYVKLLTQRPDRCR